MKLPYTLLKPVVSPPRLDSLEVALLSEGMDLSSLDWLWTGRDTCDVMAFDFETRGDDSTKPDTHVVGVAFTDSRGTVSYDFRECPEAYEYLFRGLHAAGVPLVAHNGFFDYQWPMRDFGLMMGYGGDTYSLYKLTSCEGFPLSYGLKDAQKDLLGWAETNELGLDGWLIDNGYVRNVEKTQKEGYYWREGYSKEGEGRWVAPQKAEMWRAPKDVLMYYCALDSEATYLLYRDVFKPVLDKFSTLKWYATQLYGEYLEVLLRAKLRGIQLDLDYLKDYEEHLRIQSQVKLEEFMRQDGVESFRKLKLAAALAEHDAKEPSKVRKSDIPKEPKCPRIKKDGSVNPQWLRYEAKLSQELPTAPSWTNWSERRAEVEMGEHLNPNSGLQLQQLFYEHLGYPVVVRTESGSPATDESALLQMPEAARLLEYTSIEKELTTIESLHRIRQGDVYHPSYRMPGAHTGRLSGSGGFNVQNPPKSPFMHCMKARDGYDVLSFDFTALENVVLAELSRDPVLWDFYGPHVEQGNDAYLYEASRWPVIGPPITKSGYDPLNWTKSSVSKAKKECKSERDIAKVIVLSSSYGAGARKNYETLKLKGVDITFEQVKAMIDARRQMYKGVKSWERELERQWKQNKGWLFNGFGRPIGVYEDYLKDINNRVCQSTGHDVLVLFLTMLNRVIKDRGLDAHFWIADVHDATYVEVAKSQSLELSRIITEEIIPELNLRLKATVPMRGKPEIVQTLGEDKEMERFIPERNFT